MPIAWKFWFWPTSSVGAIGLTVMLTSTGAATVICVEPEIPLEVAVTDVVPAAMAFTRPWLPAALLTVATAAAPVVHTAVVVRSSEVPSEYMPVAIIGCEAPAATFELAGVTTIDTSVAALTVSVVVPLTPPSDA